MPTINPVPSTDPTDLLFNAGKLDEFTNGEEASYTDRLGVTRRSLAGIDAAADVVLAGIGYAPPIAYAAGISLTLTTQTVEYDGEVYAPKVADLPFTTSGTFETAKFRVIQGLVATDLSASSGASMVGYMPAGTGAVASTVQDSIRNQIPTLESFGASPSASQAANAMAIQKAFSSGLKAVRVPNEIYDCGNAVLYVDHDDFMLIGDGTPTVDMATNSFLSGPVIKATISSSGNNGVTFKNIGLDSKLSTLTEGFSITNCNDVLFENVVVLGSNENNHCCLIENVKSAKVSGFTSLGGKQGLAVKAVDFFVSDVKSYDTVTYGFTIRFSPGAPCYNGFIKNISCQTNLLAKSGGFILMNDQSGAALRDLVIDGVMVDNCNNGIYITNTGNSTKATSIKFSNVIIKNIAGYAFQTFGDVDDISIDGIEFEDVSGTIYTNQATGTTRLTVSNLKQKNAGIALISGGGHKFYNWEKSGGGGFFGQNTSSNLEFYGMDATVEPFVNITDASGTGTIARKVQFPNDISIAANGLLYAMRYQDKRVKTFANTLSQNSVSDLFALPNANDCVAEITINVLSDAGRHCARFLICGTSVIKLAGNALSENVFNIVLSGTSVQFKYLWTVTGATYVDCIYSVYGQDV